MRIVSPSLQKSAADPLVYLDIMPGVNSVSEADWNTVKNTPFLKWYIDNETIVVVDAKSDSIENYTPEKAARVIDRTANRDLLLEWSTKAKDGKTAKAIEKQLALTKVA